MALKWIDRPRPILDKFRTVGGAVAFLGTLVSAGATYGVLDAAEASATNAVLVAIPGAVTLVTSLLAAFGVVKTSEPLVTPVSSPQDNFGAPLTPAGS
ncbi:hypothetical protein [Umezawaea tangerina]|uniref:Holin n=1 Tax=Umezawaea tangerina TaxID=84725 RepID=A0A2T0SPK5_9PSEU|nr:hypothetical protein [Umezawaea tangerina]PRY35338.1 hypothetical protein CLV43_114256 [Umezawaea tangerina]